MSNEAVERQSKDQIVIVLRQSASSEPRVRSIDLLTDGIQTRLKGRDSGSIEAVFKPPMAKHIRAICRTADQDCQIVNMPDYSLQFQGLSIRGYRLRVHRDEDGSRQLILCLLHAVGNALVMLQTIGKPRGGLTIFGTDAECAPPHRISSDRLFDQMLSHLYLPLVNLNSYLETILDGNRAPCPERVTSSVLQFKTKAEVLQFAFDRLISETTSEHGALPVCRPALASGDAQSRPPRATSSGL